MSTRGSSGRPGGGRERSSSNTGGTASQRERQQAIVEQRRAELAAVTQQIHRYDAWIASHPRDDPKMEEVAGFRVHLHARFSALEEEIAARESALGITAQAGATQRPRVPDAAPPSVPLAPAAQSSAPQPRTRTAYEKNPNVRANDRARKASLRAQRDAQRAADAAHQSAIAELDAKLAQARAEREAARAAKAAEPKGPTGKARARVTEEQRQAKYQRDLAANAARARRKRAEARAAREGE